MKQVKMSATADAGATAPTTEKAKTKETKPAGKKQLTKADLKAMPEAQLIELRKQNDMIIEYCKNVLHNEDNCVAQVLQNEHIDTILNGEKPTNTQEVERQAQTDAFNAFGKTKLTAKHETALGETNLAAMAGESGLALKARIVAGEDGVKHIQFEVIRLKAKGIAGAGSAGGTKTTNPYDLYVVNGKVYDSALKAIGAKRSEDKTKWEPTGDGAMAWLKDNGGLEFRLPDGAFSAPRTIADLAKKYPDMKVSAVIEVEREAETTEFAKLNDVPTSTIVVGEGDKAVKRLTVDLAKHYAKFMA